MKIRLTLQPLAAAILAVRAGVKAHKKAAHFISGPSSVIRFAGFETKVKGQYPRFRVLLNNLQRSLEDTACKAHSKFEESLGRHVACSNRSLRDQLS
jgi:hypothetical protein